MTWLRAKLARWLLSRCLTCRALVERDQRFCSDECDYAAGEQQANSF